MQNLNQLQESDSIQLIEEWEPALNLFINRFCKHLDSLSHLVGIQILKESLEFYYYLKFQKMYNPETASLDVLKAVAQASDITLNERFSKLDFLENPERYADIIAEYYLQDIISDLELVNAPIKIDSDIEINLYRHANNIAIDTRRGRANFILCNEKTANEQLVPQLSNFIASKPEEILLLNRIGSNLHFNIYCYNSISDGTILIGYKPHTSEVDTGYVITPIYTFKLITINEL
jgi:hypothetical protein